MPATRPSEDFRAEHAAQNGSRDDRRDREPENSVSLQATLDAASRTRRLLEAGPMTPCCSHRAKMNLDAQRHFRVIEILVPPPFAKNASESAGDRLADNLPPRWRCIRSLSVLLPPRRRTPVACKCRCHLRNLNRGLATKSGACANPFRTIQGISASTKAEAASMYVARVLHLK